MRTKRVKVKVESRHIKAGVAGDTGNCAIALAIREMMPHVTRLIVDSLGIWFDGRLHRAKGVDTFVRAFDRGEAVKPCTFEIAV